MSLKSLNQPDKDLLDAMRLNVGRYSYFQIMRLAHRILRKAGLDRDEALNVHPPLFSRQISKKILKVEYHTGFEEKIDVETNFLPMYGVYAAVPDKLNEDLIDYDSEANYAPRDFLDIFQNQMHRLYFDSLVIKNTPVNYVEFGNHSYKEAFHKLVGFDKQLMNELDGIDLSRFSRLCFKKHRNLKGLSKVLQYFLAEHKITYPIKVSEFSLDKAEISPKTLTKLGSKSLGKNIVIGNMISGNSSVLRYDVDFTNFGEYFSLIYLGVLEKLLKVNTWYLKFDYKYQFYFNVPKYPDATLLANPRTHLGVSSWLLDKDAIAFRSGDQAEAQVRIQDNTYFEKEMTQNKKKSIDKKKQADKNTPPVNPTFSAGFEFVVKKKEEVSLETLVFSARQILDAIEQVKTTEAKNATLTKDSIDFGSYFDEFVERTSIEEEKEEKKRKKEKGEKEENYDKLAQTAVAKSISEEDISAKKAQTGAIESINARATMQQAIITDDMIYTHNDVPSPSTTSEHTAIISEENLQAEAKQELAKEDIDKEEKIEKIEKEEDGKEEEIDYFASNQEEE